jgi:hypothetical protein
MQVPLRLCTAFKNFVKQQSYLHCPKALHCSVVVEFDTLQQILICYHDNIGHISDTQPVDAARLAAAMQQQVLESGLPQVLPGLITAVHDAVAASNNQLLGKRQAAAGGASTAAAAGRPVDQLSYLNLLAKSCLMVQFMLSTLWPSDATSYSPMLPSAVCALGLARTALQIRGNLLQQTPAVATGYEEQGQLLEFLVAYRSLSHKCILDTASRINPSNPGIQRQLLASPDLMPCLVTTIAALALVVPTKRKAAALEALQCGKFSSTTDGNTDSASSDNSSSNRGAGSTANWQQKAASAKATKAPEPQKSGLSSSQDVSGTTSLLSSWELAKQLVRHSSTCQLKQFELLGVDAQTLLWYAQSTDPAMPWGDVSRQMKGLMSALGVWAGKWAPGVAPSQVQQVTWAQRQQESELILLLPTVLLPYAWASRSDMTASDVPMTMSATILAGLAHFMTEPTPGTEQAWS